MLKFSVYELHYLLGVSDIQNYDWENLVYGENEETAPAVLLPPLDKYIVITHCFDAYKT